MEIVSLVPRIKYFEKRVGDLENEKLKKVINNYKTFLKYIISAKGISFV